MTAYATDSNLTEYVPTIFDHGVTSFTTELTRATEDVQRWIEINWYNKHFSTGFNQVGRRIGAEFDTSKLTSTQWKRATIYLALYAYILPRLSPFRVEGDSFQTQITFYKQRYNEEIQAAMAKGVEYDHDGDGSITTGEKYRHRKDRLYR
tara:strand:+ start:3493 stop:3942 length:450 start_codon:yes stop_codon:yes gene_type:complete